MSKVIGAVAHAFKQARRWWVRIVWLDKCSSALEVGGYTEKDAWYAAKCLYDDFPDEDPVEMAREELSAAAESL